LSITIDVINCKATRRAEGTGQVAARLVRISRRRSVDRLLVWRTASCRKYRIASSDFGKRGEEDRQTTIERKRLSRARVSGGADPPKMVCCACT
jgi:hypothetical protein